MPKDDVTAQDWIKKVIERLPKSQQVKVYFHAAVIRKVYGNDLPSKLAVCLVSAETIDAVTSLAPKD